MRVDFLNLYLVRILPFLTGCLACFTVRKEFGLSAVTASALTAGIGTFLPLPKQIPEKETHAIFYAGTFAGMCSPQLINSYFHVLSLSLLGALIYSLIKPYFVGFGGKLGLIAFLASVFFFLVQGAL